MSLIYGNEKIFLQISHDFFPLFSLIYQYYFPHYRMFSYTDFICNATWFETGVNMISILFVLHIWIFVVLVWIYILSLVLFTKNVSKTFDINSTIRVDLDGSPKCCHNPHIKLLATHIPSLFAFCVPFITTHSHPTACNLVNMRLGTKDIPLACPTV